MLVANIIGYDFSFNYKGSAGEGVIKIPFDGRPYKVPDDIPTFKELKKVEVVDKLETIKKEEPEIKDYIEKSMYADDVNNFPKMQIEKETIVEKKKPLAGVKIKKKKKAQILKKSIK